MTDKKKRGDEDVLIDIKMIKKKSPRLCRASDLDKSSGATRYHM